VINSFPIRFSVVFCRLTPVGVLYHRRTFPRLFSSLADVFFQRFISTLFVDPSPIGRRKCLAAIWLVFQTKETALLKVPPRSVKPSSVVPLLFVSPQSIIVPLFPLNFLPIFDEQKLGPFLISHCRSPYFSFSPPKLSSLLEHHFSANLP